jgi:hypothetical protein
MEKVSKARLYNNRLTITEMQLAAIMNFAFFGVTNGLTIGRRMTTETEKSPIRRPVRKWGIFGSEAKYD